MFVFVLECGLESSCPSLEHENRKSRLTEETFRLRKETSSFVIIILLGLILIYRGLLHFSFSMYLNDSSPGMSRKCRQANPRVSCSIKRDVSAACQEMYLSVRQKALRLSGSVEAFCRTAKFSASSM